jgi:hypothetical protein
MYRALATVFAGYWRPSLTTRFWVALFLLLVRLQKWIGFVPRRARRTTSGTVPMEADATDMHETR